MEKPKFEVYDGIGASPNFHMVGEAARQWGEMSSDRRCELTDALVAVWASVFRKCHDAALNTFRPLPEWLSLARIAGERVTVALGDTPAVVRFCNVTFALEVFSFGPKGSIALYTIEKISP